MKQETDPITDDEFILRRVLNNVFANGEIQSNAFRPRDKGRDIDFHGISFYRQACLTSPEEILATVPEEKRSTYGIVRIPVSRLNELNLTISIDPDVRIPGHVVIPELNAIDYTSKKRQFSSIKEALAMIANEPGNILLWPEGI